MSGRGILMEKYSINRNRRLLESAQPEGLPWGHTLNDFFWIRRIPGLKIMTMYSRSMIQEMGENAAGVEHPPEPQPTVLDPWPLLTLFSPDALTKASENSTDAEVEIHCASEAANRHTEGKYVISQS
ncbi:hypothetical protein DFJ43DRAFT_141795 [Lentinula guzmanii]|uniref:Uncharacterized protein n=1 Tax=Lentinula guzmanii TaxID=2804957 RepID=A0AA38MTU4_9AGAR|nr:hypothetical protein DFJ43DRAFT_141795 [Lentinula guzmanii]